MADLTTPVAVLAAPLSVLSAGAAAPYSGAHRLGNIALSGDTVHGGAGRIFGTVDRKGTPTNIPLQRRVRLHREVDGLLVREAWSDATTGAYAFTDLNTAYRYTAIAYDQEHNFRAEAADNLTPEVPA